VPSAGDGVSPQGRHHVGGIEPAGHRMMARRVSRFRAT